MHVLNITYNVPYESWSKGGGHPLQLRETVGHPLRLEKEVAMVPTRITRSMRWPSLPFGGGCSHPIHLEEEAAIAYT